MKKIDFIGQTIIFLICAYWLYHYSHYYWFNISEISESPLFGSLEFIIGLWQIISALVVFFNRKKTIDLKFYFALVFLYIIACIIIKKLDQSSINDIDIKDYYWQRTFFIEFLSYGWLIAIYYYIITIKRTFQKQEKKTYLDIAN